MLLCNYVFFNMKYEEQDISSRVNSLELNYFI